MPKPLHLPKPLSHRMQELIQSLLVLRDCMSEIRSGKSHHFIPIYGQLRSLLIEKSKKNKPLLIDLASILNQSMDIWCTRSAGPDSFPMPAEWKAAMKFNVSGFPVTVHQQFPSQTLISMEKFLDHKILYYNEQHYKTSEIIAYFANYAGGSHYATNIKKDFAEILSFGLNGQPALTNFLLQIAEVTYELGLRLLKRLNDIEIHLAAFIPEQEIEANKYLYDTEYPNSPARASIILRNDKSIVFFVSGINNFNVQVTTNRLIDFTKPHYFVFLHELDRNLNSKMSIIVDGEKYGDTTHPFPCMFINELQSHETYHNRSTKEDNTGAKFAMFSLAITDPEGSITDRSKIFIHFSKLLDDDDKSGIIYMPEGYSYSKPGTTNQELSGDFFWSNLGKVSTGDWKIPDKKNEKPTSV